jgi:hypothetical protein
MERSSKGEYFIISSPMHLGEHTFEKVFKVDLEHILLCQGIFYCIYMHASWRVH